MDLDVVIKDVMGKVVMQTSMNSKMYLNNDKLGEIGARMGVCSF